MPTLFLCFGLIAFASVSTAYAGVAPGIEAPSKAVIQRALPAAPVAPTPDLTAVAGALVMYSKSVTILVTVKPGMALTRPVTISIGFDGPRLTQTYVPATGNRFLFNDPLGDGKYRRRNVSITLTQDKPGGGIYSFSLQWIKDVYPLYNVAIGSAEFTLKSNCDSQAVTLGGALGDNPSDIHFTWYSPEKVFKEKGFQLMANQSRHVQEFAWSHPEVSAVTTLFVPTVGFWEKDPVQNAITPGYVPPPTAQLLAPRNDNPNGTLLQGDVRESTGQSCTAHYKYWIRYRALWCPYPDAANAACTPQ